MREADHIITSPSPGPPRSLAIFPTLKSRTYGNGEGNGTIGNLFEATNTNVDVFMTYSLRLIEVFKRYLFFFVS